MAPRNKPIKSRGSIMQIDNVRKQTLVLARLNEVLDMQLYLIEKKVKLDKELKQLEEESKKDE